MIIILRHLQQEQCARVWK